MARLVSGATGCKPQRTVAQTRLRSSFIYLANAVNDLRGNWATMALILAPLVLATSLCMLPDLLNLQARVAQAFAPGAHSVEYRMRNVGLRQVQVPYHPGGVTRMPAPYPAWMTGILHILFGLLIQVGNLVVLCELARIEARVRAPNAVGEFVEVYRRAIALLPAFFLVVILQTLVMVVAFALLVIPAAIAFVWICFAQNALVFDGQHSWHALLYSRDLMRGRFFRVATRLVVFLAVLSGYNSWIYGAFLGISLLVGPVATYTGLVWVTLFAVDVVWVAVNYAALAFFDAAGVRLYRDLVRMVHESAVAASEAAALQDTGPLSGVAV